MNINYPLNQESVNEISFNLSEWDDVYDADDIIDDIEDIEDMEGLGWVDGIFD